MSFLALNLNPDDISRVLNSMRTELTILAVALVIALVAIVVISVLKVQKPLKKLVRGTSWVALLVVLVLVINMILSGPMYSIVNMVMTSMTRGSNTNTGETAQDMQGLNNTGGEDVESSLTDEVIAEATELCIDLAREGMVLLKNDGVLPLAQGTKVNTFGWSSVNPIYGGVGSGALSTQYPIVSYLDGLEHGGLQYNTALTDWYLGWRTDRPAVGMSTQDWTCPEPTQAEYEAAGIYDSAVAFSNTALFIISRSGGEGADLPFSYGDPVVEGSSAGMENGDSEYADDLDASKHYLELTNRERATLEVLNEKFENVIIIVNVAAAMELGFLDEYENIKAAVLVPGGPGQSGFNALGELLTGKTNFSGKTVDIFLKDLTHAPTWNNFGHFQYDNMSEFVGEGNSTTPTFINYTDNIYVGYRFWETAAYEGLINYDEEVVYPFGYGLSYTTFEQTLNSVTEFAGTITATVTVKNTGSVPGKDVVQMYYNPPYTNGGLEKATANLVAFDKTGVLEPGASETLTLTWEVESMASYDDTAKNGTGAWVVEAGDYIISLNANSHTIIDSETLRLSEVVDLESDATKSSNQLQWAENASEITYLSRKDGFANYDAAIAGPTNFSMSEANKAGFDSNATYDPFEHNNPNDVMPETGVDRGMLLQDMRGVEYDNVLWDQFLDQLTVDDMVKLISEGGYQSTEIRSIGKTQQIDCDGPASINNNFTREGSIGFTSAVMIASTWNEDLAFAFGSGIGKMAAMMDVSGWYAPAMNIHRSAFAGRNFEYYSEDPLMSGKMAAAAVRGAWEHGVYAFIKHFAFNDQETNRNNLLCTWLTEQSAREIYLRPFELCVKEADAMAVMSAFNYVGNVYAGACDPLLNKILRDEWGFVGMVLTDYFGGYGYQDADSAIRGGNDFCLAGMPGGDDILTDTESATSIIAARQACKNILYVTCNSRDYASDVDLSAPMWQVITWVVSGVIIALLALVEVKLVQNYIKRTKAQNSLA